MKNHILDPLNDDNRSILEKIYCQYRDAMYAVAYSVTQNNDDAEDIVQEVFLRLAQKYMSTVNRLSNENTLVYYLLTATRNTALGHYKKAYIIKETPVDLNMIENHLLADDSFCSHFDSFDNPTLDTMIHNLKPIYREVLYQRFALELTIKEIADINHSTVFTIKKRLLRAKQLLRKQIKETADE